jgi:hypothetical protein
MQRSLSRRWRVVVVSLMCGLQATMASVSTATLIQEVTEVSRAETETLVKRDLAQRLKVRADQLRLISASDRTWADANLECSARKGLFEPTPTPGFLFTLAYGGKQYVYHTDRKGRIRRCEPGKPVGPISR